MSEYQLNNEQVRAFLPHRYPFLMVDKIVLVDPKGDLMDTTTSGKEGTKVVGLKNVSINEPYFQGHFPSYAILPGVLICEAMAQVSSFTLYPYLLHSKSDVAAFARDFQCILVGVDNARFRKPVKPGDQMFVETVVAKSRGKLWAFTCQALVDGQRVAEADIIANLIARNTL